MPQSRLALDIETVSPRSPQSMIVVRSSYSVVVSSVSVSLMSVSSWSRVSGALPPVFDSINPTLAALARQIQPAMIGTWIGSVPPEWSANDQPSEHSCR